MKYLTPMLMALLTVASLSAQAQARYNGEDRGRPVQPEQVNAKWQQECGGCHMAFPPGLLPTASWRQMMSELDKHFETDASLTPAEVSEISSFLLKNASNRWTATTTPMRITETVWFKTKHSTQNVAPDVWKRASVSSRTNCAACHIDADKGNFDEKRIRIPK